MMDPGKLRNKSGSTVTIPAGKASEQEAWIRANYPEPSAQRAVMAAWMIRSSVGSLVEADPDMPEMVVTL